MKKNNQALLFAEDLMKKFPSGEDYPYRSWSYPQGYLLMGLTHLYEETGAEQYMNYIREYVGRHVDKNGSVAGFTGCSMDDMMTGAVLVWLYEKTGEECLAKASRKIYASFLDYPRTREGGFLHDRTRYPGEMWVDGVFMGQMFLCRYGKVFQEYSCFRETIQQLELIYRYCHVHDGLLVHGYSQDCLAVWAGPDGRSHSVWSEGLGWYALILTEVLELLPETMPEREIPARYLLELMQGLKKYQQPESGLWYQVVDHPENPKNWCDTSGSGMFLYALAKGVALGIGRRDQFDAVIRRGYQGLLSRIKRNEKTGHYDVTECCNGLGVQNSEEDYYFYPRTVNAQEAVCSVLWGLEAAEQYLSCFTERE